MTQRLSIALAVVLAVGATGAALAKDKDQDKGKDKAKNAQRVDGHDDDDGHDRGDARNRITICHKPEDGNGRTLTVSEEAWSAHRGHGDHLGSCEAVRIDRRSVGRFDDLDRNDDGIVSRREWPFGSAAFDRVDVNDDGVISRSEFSRL
jgi:EF hand